MTRPQSGLPGKTAKIIQAAEAAWAISDFTKCIELLEKAGRLAPANTGILLMLGQYHGLRYNYAAAEGCFEKALRLTNRKTDMLAAIAVRCQSFRNPDLAERYLRLTLEQPDATPESCVGLAELCERRRQLPEAALLVERALKLAPLFPAALLIRGRLERLAGRLEDGEKSLRLLPLQPLADRWLHAQALYELGLNLDRQERFDEAMTAFLEAKALLRPQAAPFQAQEAAFRARLKAMLPGLSPGLFQCWFDNQKNLLPQRRLALLCGYARSGTTLLEQVLDAHPGIVCAEETQVFFEEAFVPIKRRQPPDTLMLPALEAADTPALLQAREAYFNGMELCLGQPVANRLLVDKNPYNSRLIPAYIRILPETKFLIALRDPRDVVLSCFMLAQAPNPTAAADLTLGGAVERYTETMCLWQSFAPLMSGHYLEVRYEDTVADLESVARRALDFLGVEWNERVLAFDEHAGKKMVLSPTYADVTKKIYKRARGRWLNYQKYFEPHLKKLEPFVKAFGYD